MSEQKSGLKKEMKGNKGVPESLFFSVLPPFHLNCR